MSLFAGNAEVIKCESNGRISFGAGSSDATITAASNPYCFNGVVTGFEAVAFQGIYQNGSGTGFFGYWKYGNAVVGSITSTGSSTAYNTTSDYRLKEDIKPVENAATRVMALNPVNFAWKADGSRVDGFIAHEAQEIVPEAVTGTKDAVNEDGSIKPQAIDQSKLVPLLTAALQEALTEIAGLKSRLAAVEAKV